jgi:hypothetical protein
MQTSPNDDWHNEYLDELQNQANSHLCDNTEKEQENDN